MNPNQPYTPPPSGGNNPYDFITNPAKPPKKPLIGGGNSFTQRIILIVGGAVLLIVVLMIIFSLFSGGGSGNTAALKQLVAEQEELGRVATLGVTKAQESSVKAQAITAQLSVETQQQTLENYLKEHGTKLSKEELAAQKDATIDEALDSAAASNRFDDTFKTTLTGLLEKYAGNLQNAYNATSNEETKKILSDSYTSTAYLLGIQ